MAHLASRKLTQKASACSAAIALPQRACPARAVKLSATPELAEESASSRRALLMGLAVAGVLPQLVNVSAAQAEGEYDKFIGYATPPTSYGGYGGNANEPPKYTFEYPAGWKQEQPNKVEKGTQGVDGRVVNPRSKDQRAFLITLGRAGEDNKSFRLADPDSTFASFAGADYNLQDALSNASSITKSEREVEGIQFLDFDIDSPEFRYLSSIAVKQGKVFALFVRCPTKNFKAAEPQLRHIIETFRLL